MKSKMRGLSLPKKKMAVNEQKEIQTVFIRVLNKNSKNN